MNVPDGELVRILEGRDGPLGSAWQPHRGLDGVCRYSELYPEGDCPWCRAERRRVATGAKSQQRAG
jgi:hypothetical protein